MITLSAVTAGDLLDAINKFAEGHDDLRKPRHAAGKCYGATWQFLQSLAELGWHGEFAIVEADGENPGLRNQKHLSSSRDFVNHYALYVPCQDTVIDFTARQFDEHCTFPMVEGLHMWRAFMVDHFTQYKFSERVMFNFETWMVGDGRASHCPA